MELKFFEMETIKNGQDVKTQYRDLIKKHHPDVGGSTEYMKQINAEYEYLLPIADKLEENDFKTRNEKKVTRHSLDDGYREMIEKIIFLDGLKIEIMGSWLWLSGNTYAHFKILKEMGFKWSNGKKAWYWYDGIDNQKNFFRGRYKLNEIRQRYGAKEVESESDKVLTSNKFDKKYAVVA